MTAGSGMPALPDRRRLAKVPEAVPDTVTPWAVVLAGGEGIRLRPLTRAICGDERPKQYVRLVGTRSLLRQTLDRLALAIPAERTVTVVRQAHARYSAEEFAAGPAPRQLVQPADRGTAAAILLAAQWVSWRDPGAVVVVCPCDHLVLGELAFMTHILNVAGFVERNPERIVLLGAHATDAEVEYGWIEPGPPVGRIHGKLVSRVRRFWEKPSPAQASACLARGCLWNTFVMVGKVATLVEVGWQTLPELSDRLSRIEPASDSEQEPWAIREAYDALPRLNFSREVLERCTPLLAVSPLPPSVRWLDLGSPDRVVRGLYDVGMAPPWLAWLRPRQTVTSGSAV